MNKGTMLAMTEAFVSCKLVLSATVIG